MTDKYAVFGNPLSHTKSPLIHRTFARDCNQDLVYTAIETPLEAFAATVDQFRSDGGKGINITAPFKLDAYEYATDRSERAQLSGAANALKFDGDRVYAENFDGVGLVNDLQRNQGFSLTGRTVLLLGTGGAARGAILPILAQSPANLLIANRTLARAEVIKAQFADNSLIQVCQLDEIPNQPFDLVLNATSASLRGEMPEIESHIFSPDGLAYELAYGKGLTPFLQLAKAAGVSRISDGVGMLVEQAAEAFEWWRGERPETRDLIAKLTIPLV